MTRRGDPAPAAEEFSSWSHVIMLIDDLDVRIVNAITGELLRELVIDLDKDYQPRK